MITDGLVVFCVLLLATALGLPVALGFFLSGGIGLWLAMGDLTVALNVVEQTLSSTLRDYNLAVIPLFAGMGVLIAASGAASDLFHTLDIRLQRVPGRLAVATVGGNAVFAAVTGVGVAAAAAFSKVSYPLMLQAGYRRDYAAGCIAGSSVLGLLIPPSVLMIVWAILTEQSVGRLFLAGIGPGLLLATLFAVYCIGRALIDPEVAPSGCLLAVDSTARQRDAARAVGVFGICILIAVTLGSIWRGWATPTEAAAIGFGGAIVLARAKRMTWHTIWVAMLEAGRTVVPILFLVLGASLYSKMLVVYGVPETVRGLLQSFNLGPGASLLAMVGMWLILGCAIDSISIMLLTVPVFWPIALSFGYDPIVFALVGILVIEAGICTPPFGIGVFVVKASVEDPTLTLSDIFWGAVPYWILLLATAYLVYLWPPLATWIPSHL